MPAIEFETQTDPIMVPFPLPPIGKIEVSKTIVTESLSIQTEYTWLLEEFPKKLRDQTFVDVSAGVTPSPKELKKSALVKKAESTKKSFVAESVETVVTGDASQEASEMVIEEGTPQVESEAKKTDQVTALPFPVPSPKKRGAQKKQLEEPASLDSAVDQTPVIPTISPNKRVTRKALQEATIITEVPVETEKVAEESTEETQQVIPEAKVSPKKRVSKKKDVEAAAETPVQITVVTEEVPVAQTTPKKERSSRKKKQEIVEEAPATPATTAVPETPVADVLMASPSPIAKSSSLLPLYEDSSDDDMVLVHKSSPIKRTITPTAVKPTIETPKEKPVAKLLSQNSTITNDNSSSESEDANESSSSSDSDADIPPAALITSSKKRKQQKTVAASSDNQKGIRFGPLVQVEKVDESSIEEIRNKFLDRVPEPLRQGAIKEAVTDVTNQRVIFHLRSTPKVAHFLTAAGNTVTVGAEEKPLVILTDADRKKAFPLFVETPVEQEESSSKRGRK
jgi:hypothetical protein